MIPQVPRDKKYEAYIAAGRHGYAATLADAKRLGARLARLTQRNDTKWNVSYVIVRVLIAENVGYYADTGWGMAVPVRGSGARSASTVAYIRTRYGVAPLVWFKRK